MHPLEHARASAKRWGGIWEDYIELHEWFDESKAHMADFRHRALRHHTEGIFLAERIFGIFIINSDRKEIPVRYIGEQHVKEDLGGKIPTVAEWLGAIKPEAWMLKSSQKPEVSIVVEGIPVEHISTE